MSFQKIRTVIKENPMLQFLTVIVTLASLHWVLIHLYINFCVKPGIWGFLSSFITLGSPVCQFLNYVQFELSKNYITMWAATAIGVVGWVIGKLV